MSGGSYEYAYFKLEELAQQIEAQANAKLLPRRMAFAQLLRLCAAAAHDIEWVDSGDSSPGDEDAAIQAVFDFMSVGAGELAEARATLKVIRALLDTKTRTGK